jgi:hypothetical protein
MVKYLRMMGGEEEVETILSFKVRGRLDLKDGESHDEWLIDN